MDELKTMNTDELMVAFDAAMVDDTPRHRVLAIFHELQRRKELHPEAYAVYKRLHTPEQLLDPTGVKLTPSWHGKECLGSGDWLGYECCCDNCDHFLVCFPDWEDYKEQG